MGKGNGPCLEMPSPELERMSKLYSLCAKTEEDTLRIGRDSPFIDIFLH